MPTRCANCGILIEWQATLVDGVAYCCVGCSQGGPCTCDYSRLPQDYDKAALVITDRKETKPPAVIPKEESGDFVS